jgi:hypothetical protein
MESREKKIHKFHKKKKKARVISRAREMGGRKGGRFNI